MPKLIEKMIEDTIEREGAYSNHPSDTGGETMWGITKWVARQNGYLGGMRYLSKEQAADIYRKQYAIKPKFDLVAEIYPEVGAELFDTGVNMGPRWPSLWLQQLLNALNRQGKDYSDIREDGEIGPQTLQALRRYKSKRGQAGERALLLGLNSLQAARYIQLARQRQANEDFLYGWLVNRVSL